MKEKIKHLILSLSTVATFLGFADIGEFIEIVGNNYELIFTTINALIAIVTAMVTDFNRIFNPKV